MSQRSPHNDRYRVDQKGKTRKSAASAKPKRSVADLSSDAKKAPAKKSAWSRAKSQSGASPRPVRQMPEASPRLKELRRVWWISWGVALAIAVAILWVQNMASDAGTVAREAAQAVSGATTATVDAAAAAAVGSYNIYIWIGWAIWAVAMGIAFYLEFVPIRKERAAMVEAARAGKPGKTGKTGKGGTAAGPELPASKKKGAKAPVIPAAHEDDEASAGAEEGAE